MNFVSEILLSVEKIEVEALNKKVPEIIYTIDGYKQEVLEYIEEIYTKFSKRPKSNALLLTKANNLINNIAEVERVVSDIKNKEVNEAENQIQIYKQQLVDAKYALTLTTNIIHMHEVILKLKSCLQSKQYADGIKLIQDVDGKNHNEMGQLDSFNGLINKFDVTKENLRNDLIKEYKECIRFHKGEPLVFTIKEKMNLEEIAMAIGFFNFDLIDEVVSFLWEDVFHVIINCKTNINITEHDNVTKLIINMVDKNRKDHYKEVFRNVCLVAELLQKHLNYKLQDNVTIVDYIGSQFRENLAELLVTNCLSDTIPSNVDELQEYKVVVEDTVHLQNELVKYGLFIDDENPRIIKYVKGIDILYLDKKCQEYLTTAMEIMKRDLHDMVEVGLQTEEEAGVILSSNEFPRCFISKSAVDLVELADKIMQNAISSKTNSEKLYSTVQNIFGMYGTEVQIYHEKLLQTIPQQVALFHNNCMYLSHKLSTWTETYRNQLAQYTEPLLFMEKAHLLKHIGNEAFVNTLKQQIKQIEDIVKNCGLSSVKSLEKLEPVAEKSIRQCLRQQELLRTVWHKVLSHSDYNRSIGCILNFLCNFIINEILKIEDISTEPGEQLVNIFNVILARGPKLFTDPKEIHLYVKSWYRFSELVFILGSSLIGICDRWADGKGPLALQFKPEEVQRLIKAIFQNTDRRAAILAKVVK